MVEGFQRLGYALGMCHEEKEHSSEVISEMINKSLNDTLTMPVANELQTHCVGTATDRASDMLKTSRLMSLPSM